MRSQGFAIAAVVLGGTAFIPGCADMDKSLGSAERAISVVNSPTAKSIGSIAKSDDRSAAAREVLKQRGDVYHSNPQAAINDLRQIERDYTRLVDFLTGNVNRTWGKKETKLPSRTHYVKYTQNYMSRAVVDFDASRITVETLDDKNPPASLKNAIVTTLLTPNDPRAVDLYSDQPVTLTSEREPYLKGLVLDQRGREIGAPADAEAFADYLVGRANKREVAADGATKTALYVEIAMVANLANKQADKFRATVSKAAAQYKVSPSLIFAIIRTESNFNPFAVSSAPAYGMMQLVPTSGGREAMRRARGRDSVPSRDELFDADNNIDLGTAYLSVLSDTQLQAIGNAISREYCVISAYNTGPSNVLRTFNRDQAEAVNEINRLEPPAVYQKLRASLPYAETRDYLQKVVGFRRQFVTAGN
jgi:membrane-bound lytic murein transglycosylase C